MSLSSTITRMAAVQAEPVWGNLAEGVAKTISIIEDAAASGVKLLAFPELWLPGYPFWIWAKSPVRWGPSWTSYIANSLRLDSNEMAAIRRCCAENDIWVLLGFSERSTSSLWMSTCWINNQGEVVGHRRKIMPTGPERCLFGNSTGDSVTNVIDSPFGRLGSLQCWEHGQPLLRFYTASQHEQIHVASWPSLFPFSSNKVEHFGMTRGGAWTLTQAHAIETGSFVLMATCVMSEGGARRLGFTDEMLKDVFFSLPGGGGSRVYGPDGRVLAGEELASHEEGIAMWDVCVDEILSAKTLLDTVGHYSRPDLLSLHVNTSKESVVVHRETTIAPVKPAITEYPALQPSRLLRDDSKSESDRSTLSSGSNENLVIV